MYDERELLMLKVLLYTTLLLLSSCSIAPKRFVYKKKLEEHPLMKASSWEWSQNRNLETKVTTILNDQEEQLLSILKGAYGLFPAKGLIPSEINSANFQHVFRYALLSLPREMKIFLNNSLKKIFLVKGLGVTTLTIQLSEDNKKNTGQFISFLDIDVLNQRINDWYTWREYTAFQNKPEFSFSPYLSYNNTTVDTSHMALSYLTAIILNWNPKYFPSSKERYFLTPMQYEFINQSWQMKDTIVTPLREDLLEELHYLRYYNKGEPLFSTEEQPIFYKEIEKTSFVNLFSMMGSSKDFIESIANYIYVEKLKHPFSIDFYEGKELINTYESCWQQVRCQQKKRIIEKILNNEVYSID